MTTLGELLASMDDPVAVVSLLAEAGELRLLPGLDEAASALGTDRCEVARDAVDAFTREADADAWVKLMGRMQDGGSPAAACLGEMVGWFLSRPRLPEEPTAMHTGHSTCNCR